MVLRASPGHRKGRGLPSSGRGGARPINLAIGIVVPPQRISTGKVARLEKVPSTGASPSKLVSLRGGGLAPAHPLARPPGAPPAGSRTTGQHMLIVAIVAVAIVLGLVALAGAFSGASSGPGNGSRPAPPLAFGTARNITGSTSIACGSSVNICYSIGVASAGPGALTTDITFSIQKAGTLVTSPGTVDLVSPEGVILATFSLFSNGWSSKGAVAVTNSDAWTLDACGATEYVSGATFVASYTGPSPGVCSVVLP